MATRKYSGPKHHSRRYHSNDNNRRRLSKQEEIDLTLDVIDLKEETIDNNENNSNINIINNNETTVAPITIHVNNVEEGCDQKVVVENERCDDSEHYNEIELGINQMKSMHKSNSNSGQSSLGVIFNTNESNSLSTGDNKEKKRGKQLTRAEAVRDTSISPPPQNSQNEENNSNMLSVISSNSQSQMGSSMSTQSHKTKIKTEGSSQGSLDRSSPCLSRDSSTENYSDSTGTDLQQFLTDTLQKNKKDRMFLLKIEQELTQLVKETAKLTLKFPQMSSYNRMLVHRVAAFYGFEHNVDSTGTSIVVNKTKNTRIPEMKFRDYIKDELLLHEPKKSILKRDSASLEDGSSQVSFDGKERSPERQTGNLSDGSRSKSFEEREERYEKARARIFNQDSSSSTEGNEANIHVILDENGSNNCSNALVKSNSSLLSSQEDLPLNWTNSTDPRAWSSTDSDSSGRLPKNDSAPIQQSVQLKAANSSDSDTTPKSTTLSSSSSSCGTSLLTPDGCNSESNNNSVESKNRPLVTKAGSFAGISRNCNDSNSTQTQLTKSGSLNVASNQTQPIVVLNNVKPNHAITPKTNVKPDNAHKPQSNNMGNNAHHPQQQQRFMSSQHQSQHQLSNTSHHNRQNWHQNHQNVHSRHNERMASIGNVVQWPPVLHQNYPQYLLHQQTDSNVNQLKENSYLQSGQQYFVSPLSNYGNQSINNEQQQHLTQQPLRLVYPNQPQLQNLSSFGNLVNNSVQTPHQSFSSQLNQVPYHQIHSSQSALNFSSNQSNIQNNSTGFNQVMQSPSIPHSYGAPLQVPSGVGTVWIINNGVGGTTNSPLIGCPPANTPPTPPIGSNIAPFVGMSYQQFRPTINSAPNLNPNYGLSAAQNRPQNSLLKTQSLMTSQSMQANTQRILPSNGNNYIQQVPELVDMNLLGANNYVNRTSIVPNPQINQMFRRMPLNPNQALDVRLIGSQQQSSPFLLPTPQRPYFPLSNSVNVNVNHRYDRYANANQRSKNSFPKNNRQQRNNTNNKNILVQNSSSDT